MKRTSTPEGGPIQEKIRPFPIRSIIFPGTARRKYERWGPGSQGDENYRRSTAPKKVYDPSHPDAKEDGYVEMPNISVLEEMVDMMSATRSYQANVTSIKMAKRMAMKALEIGR